MTLYTLKMNLLIFFIFKTCIQYKKALLNYKNSMNIGRSENLMWKYWSSYVYQEDLYGDRVLCKLRKYYKWLALLQLVIYN